MFLACVRSHEQATSHVLTSLSPSSISTCNCGGRQEAMGRVHATEIMGKRGVMHTSRSCARSLGLVLARACDSCATTSLHMLTLSSWALTQRLTAHSSAAQIKHTAFVVGPPSTASVKGHTAHGHCYHLGPGSFSLALLGPPALCAARPASKAAGMCWQACNSLARTETWPHSPKSRRAGPQARQLVPLL